MYFYGGTQNNQSRKATVITKDVLGCILNALREEHWYKLKWNSKILKLMHGLHKKESINDLARHGHIESLDGREVNFKYICEFGENHKRGSLSLIRRFIYGRDPNWNEGLEGACLVGNIDIINFLISKGANDLRSGLWEACRGGHMCVVKLLISMGADEWDCGLIGACEGIIRDSQFNDCPGSE